MNFLLPLFLGAGALASVPIILHLLRRKPRVKMIFPTLQFLGPSAVLETRRHRIRRWLTMLFRCLTILLICLAFSRPFWNADRIGHGRAVVIAVDNSFSMQTSGRWDNLRSWATDKISQLGNGDRAGILIMNPTPRWQVPITDKLGQVRDALAQMKPGYESTRYEPALRMAGDALLHSGAPEMTLAWMGDGQALGWQGVNFSTPLPPGVKLLYPPPSAPPARQAAIVKTQWDTAATGLILHVNIDAYTPAQDTRQLTVTEDGLVIAKQSITLAAHHPNRIDVPLPGVKGDRSVAVKVAMDADDLPVDDTFYSVHEPDSSRQIYLTPLESGDDSFDFVRHAIDSTKTIADAPLEAKDLPDAAWPLTSVVIVRGSSPFQQPAVARLDAFLKAGGTAFVFLDGDPAQADWLKAQNLGTKAETGSVDAPLHLRNWDLGHPLLKALAGNNLMGLLGVNFYRGVALTGVDAAPLATWDDGNTAIAEVSAGGQHFLACGFDAQRDFTDWPIHASFLPFMHSALLWLSRQENSGADWRVGDTVPLAGSGTWTRIDGPGGSEQLQASGSIRPHSPGLYQFTTNGQPHLIAVNLQPEESDLAPYTTPNDLLKLASTAPARAVPAQQATLKISREEAENQQRIWWWLLAAAVVFLLAELRLANRTTM
jgi:hypothetical protein